MQHQHEQSNIKGLTHRSADAAAPLSCPHPPPPGFHIPQEVPAHSWLRRGVAAPINRYQIKPGRHWDGVDRSNGFEKQMFKGRNEKAARDAEARAWAMSDM